MPVLLIADDHPLYREALRTTVQKIRSDARVYEADSVPTLYALADTWCDADLLLLDLGMPGGEGFDTLVHLRARHPQLPITIVSAHEDAASMRRAMDHGAMGFVPKSSDVATFAQALDSILDGEPWFPAQTLSAPATSADERRIAARLAALTPQQSKVLQMADAGRMNKQIAYDLGTSEATVKAHMSAVLRKLGASNRTEAVAIARRLRVR